MFSLSLIAYSVMQSCRREQHVLLLIHTDNFSAVLSKNYILSDITNVQYILFDGLNRFEPKVFILPLTMLRML